MSTGARRGSDFLSRAPPRPACRRHPASAGSGAHLPIGRRELTPQMGTVGSLGSLGPVGRRAGRAGRSRVPGAPSMWGRVRRGPWGTGETMRPRGALSLGDPGRVEKTRAAPCSVPLLPKMPSSSPSLCVSTGLSGPTVMGRVIWSREEGTYSLEPGLGGRPGKRGLSSPGGPPRPGGPQPGALPGARRRHCLAHADGSPAQGRCF